MSALRIPDGLAESCHGDPARTAWLENLPTVIADLAGRWSLTIGPPFPDVDGSCAWVAPTTLADGSDAVLKVALPHMEGADEIAGLRFWDGELTVRLLDADESLGAMLLERCRPGTSLRTLPEPEQDAVLGELLPRLWRSPPADRAFRPLSEMLTHWADETRAAIARLLFNCLDRMQASPLTTIADFADRLGLPTDRVRLWPSCVVTTRAIRGWT